MNGVPEKEGRTLTNPKDYPGLFDFTRKYMRDYKKDFFIVEKSELRSHVFGQGRKLDAKLGNEREPQLSRLERRLAMPQYSKDDSNVHSALYKTQARSGMSNVEKLSLRASVGRNKEI